MKTSELLGQVRKNAEPGQIKVWNDKRKTDRRIKIECRNGHVMKEVVRALLTAGVDFQFYGGGYSVIFTTSL